MIHVETRVVRPDLIFKGGSHRLNVVLAPHVRNVRPGTPLKPTPLGWDVAREWTQAKRIAVTAGGGGSQISSVTSASFELARDQYLTGDTLAIKDVDDTGYVTFERATDGPFYAESTRTIFMTV